MNSDEDMSVETNLPNLPEEIWEEIFSYLSLNDRKNLRLTCKDFYEVCNNIRCLKNEEIVFHGNINTVAALRSLSNSERKLWNITLHDMIFYDDIFLTLFEKQGKKIYSLTFDNCVKFNNGILRKIIEHCENLKSFSFIICQYYEDPQEHFKYVSDEFIQLKEKGITRQNVTSFALELSAGSLYVLTNTVFLSFFDIFPNIKELELSIEIIPLLKEFGDESISEHSNSTFTVNGLHYVLSKMGPQLEKLSLNFIIQKSETFDSYPTLESLNKIFYIKMERLDELSLNWNFKDPREIFIINPFLKFANLTHFKWFVQRTALSYVSAYIHLLLKNAVQLRSLVLRSNASFSINKNCFQELVESKLITLDICIMVNYITYINQGGLPGRLLVDTDFNPSSLLNSLKRNNTIKYLNIFARYEASLLSLFLICFQGLNTLKVRAEDLIIVNDVLKYQSNNLKRFILHLVKYSENHAILQQWTTDKKLNYRQFNNLTHLWIREYEVCRPISPFILDKFIFPKLISLSIDTRRLGGNIVPLLQAVQKLTSLESLEIQRIIQTSFEQWLVLLKALPNLRHFYMRDGCLKHFDDFNYLDLFEECSSLRTIVHEYYGRSSNTVSEVKYFKDITRGENTIMNIYGKCFGDHKFLCEGIPHHYLCNKCKNRFQGKWR